jgi:hypothetical protein
MRPERKYDPRKRDSSWQMVIPGCYMDPAGHGHIFPDEVLAELQRQYPEMNFDPCSRGDYDIVIRAFKEMMQEQSPGTPLQFVEHERSHS